MSAFRRILVATDLSEASAPAFEHALRMAQLSGAKLLVAHAYQDRCLPELGFAPPASFEEWDRCSRTRAEHELAPLVARAWGAGVEAELLLLGGFPEDAIVAAAADRGADLVVVGTHGRRGPARLFMGSVAARVVASARCPVLTVPPGSP